MKNQALILVVIAALWTLLAGCSATTVKQRVATAENNLQARPVQVKAEFEEIDSRAYHHYVNGLLFEGISELPAAAASFQKAWELCPESAEIGLAYARSLVRLRNYTAALEALDRITTREPGVLELRAFCLHRLGDLNGARQTYLELAQADSSSEVAFMFLADFYRQNRNLDSAAWALSNLARILPDRHQVLNELGNILAANGDMEAAKEQFRRSWELRSTSENTGALLRLAEIFERADQPDSALKLFEQELEQHPANVLLHENIARLWLTRDSARKALPHLRAVVKLSPSNFPAQRRLAITYLTLDSVATADSILTALVTTGDADPINHFWLARVSFLQEDFERARDELVIVTEKADHFADGWLALGFAHRQLGDSASELATYQDGLLHMQDEQTAIQLYFALGAAFEQSGQIDSAVTAFEEILAHNPDHAPSLNYLGYTLADHGLRLEYARELIARAVELQPGNAAYLDSYGWVFYRLGSYDSAVQYLSAAAELDSDPVIYDHLGDAYRAVGELDKAREWWQKALDQQPGNEAIRGKLDR